MVGMRSVTIIGGGIAGLTLGILLRERKVPVLLHEAGVYPRHRVCGEFICGKGREVLRQAGLEEPILAAGGRKASSLRFFSKGSPARQWKAPPPALCISRYRLDALLAERFTARGGDLRTGARWQHGFHGEGVVRATGRNPAKPGKWRWIGIKAHRLDLGGASDLEMHFGARGYAGVARLGEGRANVCALIRSRGPMRGLEGAWKGILGELAGQPESDWDERSFCAVAGISFLPEKRDPEECRVGDAFGMIAPLTGNGMSIALESAALAAEPLAEYSRGKLPWEQARRKIARDLDSQFLERLRWARIVQNLVFTWGGQAALRMLARSEWVLHFLLARTH